MSRTYFGLHCIGAFASQGARLNYVLCECTIDLVCVCVSLYCMYIYRVATIEFYSLSDRLESCAGLQPPLQLVERGTHAELVAQEGEYFNLYNVQAQAFATDMDGKVT